MHIAVDAREMTGHPTGVGTYLRQLLRHWQQMPDSASHRWTLYVPEARMASGTDQQGAVAGSLPPDAAWRTLPGDGGTWWEQGRLAWAVRRDRPDVLFAPGYTAPLTVRLPVVLTVHDLSFVAHPEWFSAREGLRRRLLTRLSARRARAILTVSEFSRREIVERFKVPAACVHAIPHGISRPSTPPPPAEARPPVVLFVGSIFNRRHVPDLIRAFAMVAPRVPDAQLQVVGDNRTHPPQDLPGLARSLGVADRVALRAYVPHDELGTLYGRARAFAFLSEYEGFGFTPLEAIAHSVPVLVLDTPVAREIYDTAATYVPAGDIAATAAALERLLLDADFRRERLRDGARVLERYRWSEAARRTLRLIEQAGARG